MRSGCIAVIDIGKTNAKLALVDKQDLSEVEVVTRPNTVQPGPPYPHFDVDGHWDFLLDGLATFQASHGIDAITVTTHGASCALLGFEKTLAAPVLDYEFEGPDEVAEAYDALRPDFAETGSPKLPGGQNVGAQIFWQFHRDPDLLERTRAVVTYPQYWGYRLTGELACDISSIGAHTDLWNPYEKCLSPLAETLGIADKIAPVKEPGAQLGTLKPEIAERTGLLADTPVFCGIHDSNASLLPHVLHRALPFSVVSTGTWVIVMTMGGASDPLDPTRDTLINVNGLGHPVPSARYMGGREFEVYMDGHKGAFDDETQAQVAKSGSMLMPALVQDSGPFQGREATWIGSEPLLGSAERAVAVGFYLAMMTAECLALTGHRGDVIVEGPFGKNAAFLSMLSVATGAPVSVSQGATGTSQGAALLTLERSALPPAPVDTRVTPTAPDALADYARRWREAVRDQ